MLENSECNEPPPVAPTLLGISLSCEQIYTVAASVANPVCAPESNFWWVECLALDQLEKARHEAHMLLQKTAKQIIQANDAVANQIRSDKTRLKKMIKNALVAKLAQAEVTEKRWNATWKILLGSERKRNSRLHVECIQKILDAIDEHLNARREHGAPAMHWAKPTPVIDKLQADAYREIFFQKYVLLGERYGASRADFTFLASMDGVKFDYPRIERGLARPGCIGQCGLPFHTYLDIDYSWYKAELACQAFSRHDLKDRMLQPQYADVVREFRISADLYHCPQCYKRYQDPDLPEEVDYDVSVYAHPWRNDRHTRADAYRYNGFTSTTAAIYQADDHMHTYEEFGRKGLCFHRLRALPRLWENRTTNALIDQHPVHGLIMQATEVEEVDASTLQPLWDAAFVTLDKRVNCTGDSCSLKASNTLCKRFCKICVMYKEKLTANTYAVLERNSQIRALQGLLHLMYTFSFYWTGRAADEWRVKFVEELGIRVHNRKIQLDGYKAIFVENEELCKKYLDEDDHTTRYSEARARLESQEKELAFREHQRLEAEKKLQENKPKISTEDVQKHVNACWVRIWGGDELPAFRQQYREQCSREMAEQREALIAEPTTRKTSH